METNAAKEYYGSSLNLGGPLQKTYLINDNRKEHFKALPTHHFANKVKTTFFLSYRLCKEEANTPGQSKLKFSYHKIVLFTVCLLSVNIIISSDYQ